MPNAAAEKGVPFSFPQIAVPTPGSVTFPCIVGFMHGGRRITWQYAFAASPTTLDLRLQAFAGPSNVDPASAGNDMWADIDSSVVVGNTSKVVANPVNTRALRISIVAITGAPGAFDARVTV